jgi:hypothetical protein
MLKYASPLDTGGPQPVTVFGRSLKSKGFVRVAKVLTKPSKSGLKWSFRIRPQVSAVYRVRASEQPGPTQQILGECEEQSDNRSSASTLRVISHRLEV